MKNEELLTAKNLNLNDIPLPKPSVEPYFDVYIGAVYNKYTSPLPEYLS